MHDDDAPVGRLLTRREALALIGLSGVGLLAGCRPAARAGGAAAATRAPCIVRPEQTEGPYYVDERLERADLRSDPGRPGVKPGVPLLLTFAVAAIRGGACAPLPGARVDVWHCDADGVYSDVRDPRFDTRGQRFLRGYQRTDAEGRARFTTIYPGWYEGRTVHVHFMVRTPDAPARAFTSQLYFDDALSDRVFAGAPYAARGARPLRNADDGIYADGGEQLMLTPIPSGDGYAATFDLGLALDG